MRVTIQDVADYAGVSKATVSRFLNNVPGSMSAATHAKVAQAVEKLQYKPNLIARSLRGKSSYTIAVVVSNILNPYTMALTSGIEEVCNLHEYNLVLCNTQDNPGKQRNYIDILTSKQMDGYIIQPAQGDGEYVEQVAQRSPVVLVDRIMESCAGIDAVVVDNKHGAKKAVEYLIGLGHQRIATFLPCPDNVTSRQERLMGYGEALQENGIKPRDDYVRIFTPGKKEAGKAVQALLEMECPPTALLTMNGWITLEVISALKELDVKIPAEISLVGFDDPEWARLIEPSLTVVSQPVREIGRVAAELLFNRIFGKNQVLTPQFVQLETTFVQRCSSVPPLS